MNLPPLIRIAFNAVSIIVLLLFSAPVLSGHSIQVLHNPHSKLHSMFISKLQDHTDLTINTISEPSKITDSYLLTLGNNACETAAKEFPNKNILCNLIPSKEFKRIQKQYRHKSIGAIFIDQPASREIALLRQHFPSLKRVAIINDRDYKSSNKDITIKHYDLVNPKWITVLINKIAAENDVILATKNISTYNAKTITPILLQSYKRRIPIIGFSKNFVESGAIAGVYSSLDDLSKTTAQIINNDKLHSETPVIYPLHYSIRFNDTVIRTLYLDIKK